MMMKLCTGCSRAFRPEELRRSRCPACIKVYERARGSAHQRGYDHQHQRLAKQAIAAHPYCADCHSTEDLCADHIVPLSRGGTNTPSNYQVRCRSCNTARRNVDRRKRATPGAPSTSKKADWRDPAPGFRESHSRRAEPTALSRAAGGVSSQARLGVRPARPLN